MSRNVKFFLGIACFVVFGMATASSFAGEIDILVDKLVQKGVLTYGEAQQILTETKEEVRAEMAKGTYSSLPAWVQNLKLKGDFRLRYQYQDLELGRNLNSDRGARHRGRIRFRLGLETKINDYVKVAAGLATGGGDPRSTNQTFTGWFSTKGINLDYAYLQYDPYSWLTLYGGKMKRKPVLWEPTDLLWDGDITPEGGAILLSNNFDAPYENLSWFINNGVFVMTESSATSNDAWMVYTQPGLKWKINGNNSLKGAFTYYHIDSAGRTPSGSAAGTNTLNTAGNYFYNYDAVSPAFQWDVKEPLWGLVPYFGLFGEYVHALDTGHHDRDRDQNYGWAAGIKFGDKKVKKGGQWQVKYIYRYLQRDAWLDILPDSDAYNGDTNVRGHEVALTYGLGKNVSFGLDYYYMQPIKTLIGINNHTLGKDNAQHVVQADILCKF